MDQVGSLTYTRIRQIGAGQGQNSIVWYANDPQRAGKFAVKEIDKANFGARIDEFFAEAQAMFAVDHPNVVRVDCAFQTADKICLGMKYYPDGSLLDQIDPSPLPVSEVIRIGTGILSGLTHIHTRGFIHFDLKPSNILMNGRTPMIADFGQTRPIGADGMARWRGIYEQAVPPECYGGTGTFPSDIYQVGLLLYRAANGELHFSEQRKTCGLELEIRTCNGRFPDRNRFLPHVPRFLRTVIKKAISVDPADRYPSPPDFMDALGKVSPKLNWQTTAHMSGEIEWRAERVLQPDLLVKLLQDGKRWKTEVHTDGGSLRRVNPTDPTHWANGLTRNAAFDRLKNLFSQWE